MEPTQNIKDTAEAVKGIVEAVPIYQDLLQPAVQELGRGVHTLSKTVHIALAPISALVWGYEQISGYLQTSLEERLENIPKEDIISPDPSIAGPAIDGLRYTGHKKELREMFSNLIASSMDRNTAMKAHPSFVDIIQQINTDEAKIIKLLDNNQSKALVNMRAYNQDDDHYLEPIQNFSVVPELAGCEFPELGPSYIVNLNRLGIIDISKTSYSTLPNSYEPILDSKEIEEQRLFYETLGKRVEIVKRSFTRTAFGKKFYESCILEK